MAQISERSRLSVGLVISVAGLAFWTGSLATNQARQTDDIQALKVQIERMNLMAQDIARMSAKVDLLLMLEPRDQERPRKR